MTALIIVCATVVAIVLIARVCLTVERLKGVSQNAGLPELPGPRWSGPPSPSDGMSQP